MLKMFVDEKKINLIDKNLEYIINLVNGNSMA